MEPLVSRFTVNVKCEYLWKENQSGTIGMIRKPEGQNSRFLLKIKGWGPLLLRQMEPLVFLFIVHVYVSTWGKKINLGTSGMIRILMHNVLYHMPS